MPKPKARPHSRQGSSTSIVRMGGLPRADSTQRLDRLVVQPPPNLNLTQLPPKKTKQQGRQAQQPAIQQPTSRRHANGGARQAAAADDDDDDDDSDEDEDAWVSSESGAVTPNPEPADLERVEQTTVGTDDTTQLATEPTVTPRTEHPEPLLGTPKPVLKLAMPPADQVPPPPSSATPATATTATITRETPTGPVSAAAHLRPAHQLQHDKVPVLLASPAVQSELRPQQEQPPPRRARPQSAIFPAGAGMTLLNPDRDLNAQRRRGSAHTIDEPVGAGPSRKSRPVSVHSLVGLPSRPHPLLRGISHSGMATPTTSVGPLLSADPARALLSPTTSTTHIPRSTPSSPGSSHAAPASGGGLFRRKSVSSIKSVATLPATSATTAVSDISPALSTSPGSQSISGTTAYDSRLDSAAGRLRQHTASALDILHQAQAANKAGGKAGAVRSSEPPANRLVVTFAQARALDPFRSNRRAAPHPLLSEEAVTRHVAVTQFVDPGMASLERVLGLRGPLSVPPPPPPPSSSRTASSKLRG